jgi:hypothetical protein
VIAGLGPSGYRFALQFADRDDPGARSARARRRITARNVPMDLRKLKTLIDLVAESGISELEITEGEGKVRIVKGPTPMPAGLRAAADECARCRCPAPAARGGPAAAPLPEAPRAAAETRGHVVKSPMVGTFYRSAIRTRGRSSKSARRSRKATRCASSRR